ncbi:MAG: BLUF domain-containing protein [Balneolales bacterium]
MKNGPQDKPSMIRLTYISHKKDFVTDGDVKKLISDAAASNKKKDITGLLIISGKIFYQILEGEEKQVLDLFNKKLSHDKRYANIVLIKQGLISKREYSGWSMREVNLNDAITPSPIKNMLEELSTKVMEDAINKNALTAREVPKATAPEFYQTVDKVIFFSDIVSFSALSVNLEPHHIIDILNLYMNIVTTAIVENGGRVSKILGDGVMACFDSDQVVNAIKASLQILGDLQHIRDNSGHERAEKVLYTGIGLASGPVIEGNMGSEQNVDYTIIGDSVNLSSRLESMTRLKKESLIFSKEIGRCLGPEWDVVEMGKHIIKGKELPIELFSIRSPVTEKPATGIELEWEIAHHLQVGYKE